MDWFNTFPYWTWGIFHVSLPEGRSFDHDLMSSQKPCLNTSDAAPRGPISMQQGSQPVIWKATKRQENSCSNHYKPNTSNQENYDHSQPPVLGNPDFLGCSGDLGPFAPFFGLCLKNQDSSYFFFFALQILRRAAFYARDVSLRILRNPAAKPQPCTVLALAHWGVDQKYSMGPGPPKIHMWRFFHFIVQDMYIDISRYSIIVFYWKFEHFEMCSNPESRFPKVTTSPGSTLSGTGHLEM